MTQSRMTILAALAVSLLSAAALASDNGAGPDLSGVWGRNTIDYTAPPAGKGKKKARKKAKSQEE